MIFDNKELHDILLRIKNTDFFKKYILNIYEVVDDYKVLYFEPKQNNYTKKELLEFQTLVEDEDLHGYTISPLSSAINETNNDFDTSLSLKLVYKGE